MKKILLIIILLLATSVNADWKSGNNLGLILKKQTCANGDYFWFYSYDADPTKSFKLIIWSNGSETSDTFLITHDSADVYMNGVGTDYYKPTLDSIGVGQVSAIGETWLSSIMIFSNITIAAGATIDSAFLSGVFQSCTDSVLAYVVGYDTDSATNINTFQEYEAILGGASVVTGDSCTTAYISWALGDNQGYSDGSVIQTKGALVGAASAIGVRDIIQEIIDRAEPVLGGTQIY